MKSKHLRQNDLLFSHLIHLYANYIHLTDKLSKENPDEANKIADEIIKNTYRTLMTRGQKGCYIYCTDKKLSDYLKKRLNQNNGITYPIDNEENINNLMVAEDSEEYKYE